MMSYWIISISKRIGLNYKKCQINIQVLNQVKKMKDGYVVENDAVIIIILMSVYSGFATRQQENKYNSLI